MKSIRWLVGSHWIKRGIMNQTEKKKFSDKMAETYGFRFDYVTNCYSCTFGTSVYSFREVEDPREPEFLKLCFFKNSYSLEREDFFRELKQSFKIHERLEEQYSAAIEDIC